jgi:hypothetical protein
MSRLRLWNEKIGDTDQVEINITDDFFETIRSVTGILALTALLTGCAGKHPDAPKADFSSAETVFWFEKSACPVNATTPDC